MGRNNKDFDNGMAYSDDPVANRLAKRGIVKNTHGQKKPQDNDEYMQEPDFDR
jgi:hypothetical protein